MAATSLMHGQLAGATSEHGGRSIGIVIKKFAGLRHLFGKPADTDDEEGDGLAGSMPPLTGRHHTAAGRQPHLWRHNQFRRRLDRRRIAGMYGTSSVEIRPVSQWVRRATWSLRICPTSRYRVGRDLLEQSIDNPLGLRLQKISDYRFFSVSLTAYGGKDTGVIRHF